MSKPITCQDQVAIVLPSLNPDEKFDRVVDGLLENGFSRIVIVDDGSDEAHQGSFSRAETFPQCHVLHHGVNKGKGRALKTAFAFVLERFPELKGVITIDGDGQHLVQDIIACGDRMLKERDKVVMGCRNFDLPGVPARSVAGNKTTSRLFRLCYGIRLSDTQTGLRAIPYEYLKTFCNIEGERFEYETNMLLQMKRLGIGFVEQPIETVYEDENSGSHYNAFKDSWRIFKIMFKFLLSSGAAALIDFVVFYLLLRLFGADWGASATVYATIIARVFSSFVNFNANKSLVFRNQGHYQRSLVRYYLLCVVQTALSAGLVTLFSRLIGQALGHAVPAIVATLVKVVVDVTLFFISYGIQREWVFSTKD